MCRGSVNVAPRGRPFAFGVFLDAFFMPQIYTSFDVAPMSTQKLHKRGISGLTNNTPNGTLLATTESRLAGCPSSNLDSSVRRIFAPALEVCQLPCAGFLFV